MLISFGTFLVGGQFCMEKHNEEGEQREVEVTIHYVDYTDY